EWRTTQVWFASPAKVVASSNSTVATIRRLGLVSRDRPVDVIPVGADHLTQTQEAGRLPAGFSPPRPFVFYPANTSPHKNHEILLDAVAALKDRVCLVLTGDGTDLA